MKQDALRKFRKNLRISESTDIMVGHKYYSKRKIGTIWRISKNKYGYTVKDATYRSAMNGYISPGKASTFDEALVLIFAYHKGTPLVKHNKHKSKQSTVKGLYPHQDEAVRHSTDNYYEQGLNASYGAMLYESMRMAMRTCSVERSSKAEEQFALEDGKTVTVTDYVVNEWPANPPNSPNSEAP